MDPENEMMAESYKKDGNTAFLAGRCEEAVALFSLAIELTPQNEVLWSNRSGAYTRMGKYGQALSDAEQVITLKPSWMRGLSRKASALEGLGSLQEAHDLYMTVLRSDPSNKVIKQSIETLTMKLEQIKEDAARAKDVDLIRADSLQKAGNESKKEGNFAAAAKSYEEAIQLQKLDEKKGTLYSNLSAVLLLQEKHEEALSAALKTIELRPDWSRGYTRRGAAMWAMKKFGGALSSYKEAMLLDPTNNELHTIYHKIERERDYHATFGDATQTQPQTETADSLKEKGNTALKGGDLSAAIQFYTKGIELEEGNHILYSNRSAALLSLKDYDGALQDAVKCTKLAPTFAKAFARKAQAIECLSLLSEVNGVKKYDLKRLPGAIKSYIEANEKDPTNVTYLDKAVELEHIIEAAQEEERARADEMEDEDFHNPLLGQLVAVEDKAETQQLTLVEDPDILGDRKFNQGDFPGAIGHFTKAIKKDPSHPVNYMKRGIGWVKVRRFPKAIVDFEKCIELHPSDVEGYVQKGNTLIKLAGHIAESDPNAASEKFTLAVEAFEFGQQMEKQNGVNTAESRFEGLLAHARNEQAGFEAVKDDRIHLLAKTKAKPAVWVFKILQFAGKISIFMSKQEAYRFSVLSFPIEIHIPFYRAARKASWTGRTCLQRR